MRHSFAWGIGLFAGLFAGCAGRDAHEARSRPPADFAIGLTLLNTESEKEPSLHPAWYLLEADSQLRAATGARRADSLPPGVVRQLAPGDVDALWRIVDGAGFAEKGRSGSLPGELESPGGTEAGPTALVYLAAEGRRRSFRVALGAEDPREPGARELAEMLSGFAGVAK